MPIPGTTKAHRLKENLGAAATLLTGDDLRQIEEALARHQGGGGPLPRTPGGAHGAVATNVVPSLVADYLGFFLRISSSRFFRYSSYSFFSSGSFGVP